MTSLCSYSELLQEREQYAHPEWLLLFIQDFNINEKFSVYFTKCSYYFDFPERQSNFPLLMQGMF